jgi:hypothetical protein
MIPCRLALGRRLQSTVRCAILQSSSCFEETSELHVPLSTVSNVFLSRQNYVMPSALLCNYLSGGSVRDCKDSLEHKITMTVQAPKPAVLSEAVEEAYKKREQERLEETKKAW